MLSHCFHIRIQFKCTFSNKLRRNLAKIKQQIHGSEHFPNKVKNWHKIG